MLSITKIFTFEAAHRISDHDGACSQLHGHSYSLHVTVSGDDLKKDMLLDFKDLKKIVQEEVIEVFDHALLLKESEKNLIDFEKIGQKIFWMPYEPTAERILLWMKDRIAPQLPSHVKLEGLTLYETATCYARWKD
ncbi:queuosine biosynthesis protein QueD [Belliella baltica DSM 15883]|uniref:6-carboxy-5,6,7,8-tetrahydropterin synthase n=2 Tax=Cyclobacteriaceae TaxID=563798 RepID=I3Z5Q7_BELBD|nr:MULTISPECIES: 6-carboxytetrahydropterin synthase QueD [Cyclobacteriaceae]AFL84575.1 queuosine biosynthesis protein QueD [Belliella baltica DSM 15883]MBW3469800.1 6-carboxytetrahydropterin synthase QueD [Arthrospiribacter ruber]